MLQAHFCFLLIFHCYVLLRCDYSSQLHYSTTNTTYHYWLRTADGDTSSLTSGNAMPSKCMSCTYRIWSCSAPPAFPPPDPPLQFQPFSLGEVLAATVHPVCDRLSTIVIIMMIRQHLWYRRLVSASSSCCGPGLAGLPLSPEPARTEPPLAASAAPPPQHPSQPVAAAAIESGASARRLARSAPAAPPASSVTCFQYAVAYYHSKD